MYLARQGRQSDRHSGFRWWDCLYIILGMLKAEASNTIITGIILVCRYPSFTLFNPSFIYLYVFYYYVSWLGFFQALSVPMCLATPTGDSLVVDYVYRSFIMTIQEYDTQVDIIMVNMVDFHVILGVDQLTLIHKILYYFSKTFTLAMLSIPLVVCQSSYSYALIGIISYIRGRI